MNKTIQLWPEDLTHVSMAEAHEVAYWTERFQAPAEIIQKAIAEVGPLTICVDRYLQGYTRTA